MDMSALLTAPPKGPLSTSVKACPEGEYRAIIDDGDKWIQFREFTSNKNGQTYQTAEVTFLILDDAVKSSLGKDKVFVPWKTFLDVVVDNGVPALDDSEGKNVSLGRLMDTAGVNGQGILALRGKGPFMVKVAQRSDEKDPSIKYAEVKRVSKLG